MNGFCCNNTNCPCRSCYRQYWDYYYNNRCNQNCDACNRCPQIHPEFAVPPENPGQVGAALGFADFYALMPPDNAATVAPGTDVAFPRDGANSGSGITRIGANSFNLAEQGSYMVLFQVSVDEPGQLILTLNGQDLAYTVAGRATGTSQITGISIVTTPTENSVLTVRNPAGEAAALTITPLAGGTRPVSAHLTIVRLA